MPGPVIGQVTPRKRQTLESLSSEAPYNLQTLHRIIRDSVSQAKDRVTQLERVYYGPEGSLETEARRWLPVIQQLLQPLRWTSLISLEQLQILTQRRQDASDPAKHDPSAPADPNDPLQGVLGLLDKIRSTIRQGLAETANDLRHLLELMTKYCQSFSPAEGERYLQTSTSYEQQRRELQEAVALNLDRVPALLDAFEKEGLALPQFSSAIREAGLRAGCQKAAFLLLVPSACIHLRNACKGLEMWLEADAEFLSFVELDVRELLLCGMSGLEKAQHRHTLGVGEAEHSIKTLHRHLQAASDDLHRLQPRKRALEAEAVTLEKEQRRVKADLDIKQCSQQQHWTQPTPHSHPDVTKQLSRQITDLRTHSSDIDRKLEEVRKKQEFITRKEKLHQQLSIELEAAQGRLRAERKCLRKAEVEVRKAHHCLDKLRDIQRLKASPETLRKIFMGMPLARRHATGRKTRRGKLDSVCQLVEQTIDTDWIRLYHSLPFHPPRGSQIIADDVGDVSKKFLRHNTEEQARQSLVKWRRLHTRACVEDLREALQTIKRPDVLERIDAAMTSQPRSCVSAKRHRTVQFPKAREKKEV